MNNTRKSQNLFIDDVLFEESASCLEPSGLAISNETTTGATLSWTAGSDETTWDIYVTDVMTDVPDETTTPTYANVTTKPYDLTGLTSCTIYYAYVRAVKDSDKSAWSSAVIFHTECEPIALPYSYDFEGGSLPVSWNTINTNTSYNTIRVMDAGSGVLSFYRESSNGDMIAVLPEVAAAYPLNGYQILFDACYYGNSSSMTSGKLGIGIMSDPKDISTFELIEEVDITDGFSTFGSHTVWLNSYTGTGRYIAIKNIYTQSGYVLVDNVAVTELPAVLSPTNLAVANLTETSAELSWTANNGEAEWNVYYKKSADTDYTEKTGVTKNPYTLTGLEACTSYDFYVVAVSSSGTSAPSEVKSFKTKAGTIASFPWTEDFNGLTVDSSIPDGWDNSEGTVTNVAYKWWYNTRTSGNGAATGTSHDGSNCVQFDSYNPSSGQTNFLKTVPLALPSTPGMQLTFWYKNPAGGDFSVYISTDGGATHETALATGLTGASDWTKIDPINLSTYAGQTVVIVFKGTSNWGSNDAYIYLDDVTVEEIPACAAPTGLSVTNITTNSAELSWTANSGESDWTIYYKKVADTNYTEVTGVTENPYTLTGLDAGTDYVFYVVAHKGTDTSNPSITCNFTTDCEVFVVDATNSFFEGFEGTTFVPDCWTNVTAGTHQWSKTTTYYHSGSVSAYSGFYGDVYLKMPNIQINGDAVLSFWSYNTWVDDYYKNSVVLFDGSNEIELWSPSEVTSSWVNTVIDLSAYKGQTISLAFKYEGDDAHGWFIDDVQVAVPTDITLANNGTTNSTIIEENNGKVANVKLSGRTLFKDNNWNTLYLPFGITNINVEGNPLNGAVIRELNDASISGSTLTLNFKDATTAIKAGTPYIVKWEVASNSTITDPVFSGVTIDKTVNNYDNGTGDTRVRFLGTYDAITFNNEGFTEDRSILFLGDENTLYYPQVGVDEQSGNNVYPFIGACRAYFKIGEDGAGARQITGFNLNFDDGETSGIITTNYTDRTDATWFTIDGKKLDKAPTRKGLYILNGKKVVIK